MSDTETSDAALYWILAIIIITLIIVPFTIGWASGEDGEEDMNVFDTFDVFFPAGKKKLTSPHNRIVKTIIIILFAIISGIIFCVVISPDSNQPPLTRSDMFKNLSFGGFVGVCVWLAATLAYSLFWWFGWAMGGLTFTITRQETWWLPPIVVIVVCGLWYKFK